MAFAQQAGGVGCCPLVESKWALESRPACYLTGYPFCLAPDTETEEEAQYASAGTDGLGVVEVAEACRHETEPPQECSPSRFR